MQPKWKALYNCWSMIRRTRIVESGPVELMLPALFPASSRGLSQIQRQPDTGEEVQETSATMILGKRTPPGVYHELFEELLALARKHKCSALSVRVTRRNDPTTQMDWQAPVDEVLQVFEVKPAES